MANGQMPERETINMTNGQMPERETINMTTFDRLPVEIIMKIFANLDTHDNVLLVNKLFYSIACIMDGKVNLRINAQMDSKLLHGLPASYRNISTLRIMGPSLKENHQTIIAIVERFSESLRSLTISRMTLNVPTFLEILSFAPKIEHLDIRDIYLCTDVGLSKKRYGIELMELKSLSISACDDEFVEVFDQLSEGVLVKLRIRGFQWNVLTALLNRQSNIKTLELGIIRGIAPSCPGYVGDTTVFDKLTLDSLILRGDKMGTSSTATASILSKQTTLNSLTFRYTSIVDEHVYNALANLLELEELSMNFDDLIAAPLKDIGKIKKLKDLTLTIGGCENAINIFEALAQCKSTSIEKVTLNGYVPAIPTDTISALARCWHNLKYLKIAGGKLSLAAILRHFNFVEVLDINTWDVELVAQEGFISHVKELKIRSKEYVSMSINATKLSSLCRNLTKLEVVSGDPHISTRSWCDINMKRILDAWPKLESLILRYYKHSVTVDDWDYLVRHKTHLKFMSVGYMASHALSDHVPAKLRQNFGVVELRYECIEAAIDQNEMNRGRERCGPHGYRVR